MNLKIRLAEAEDKEKLESLEGFDYNSIPENYFEVHFADLKKYSICLAEADNQIVGFCFYNRSPKYNLFNKMNIPEIQDLFVLSAHRRQGIGSALLDFCEDIARKEDVTNLGVAVAVHSGFGTAQRLYVQKGFVPDGQGVNYDRTSVQAMEMRPIDDDLCLMMVKEL